MAGTVSRRKFFGGVAAAEDMDKFLKTFKEIFPKKAASTMGR